MLCPGLNPSVAILCPRKEGSACERSHPCLAQPDCSAHLRKTFFKAEKSRLNGTSTQVIVLTQTDVDSTNRSYYGQSSLYLLSAAGNFDIRIDLDKEGPIHDYA
jgi:translation initiation factor 2A